MEIVKVKDLEHLDNLIETNETVLVKYEAPWCGPCKSLDKVLEEVDSVLDEVVVAKVNCDELPDVAAESDVRGIPTLHLWKDAAHVAEHVGVLDAFLLIQFVKDSRVVRKSN